MSDFLSGIYRAVLLGNPGGGKSTFTLKLCHVLATCYLERLFAGREVTPILVVLRDYGAKKKELNCSILQFIETTANSDYQIQPPSKAFEYLLLNGRALVIFDGLDELLDTSYRQEISSDVESFCNLYPSVPVLVTSREVGYDQAPLDQEKFEIFRLAPFDEGQVQEYATKWFDVNTDLTLKQRQQKVAAFLEESKPVPDLRSNPLLLALMCNIYRGEGYIPKKKPDVYGKCAEMLFERWDKGRGIQVPLPIKKIEFQIKYTMMYLAHWIYSDEALQSGVTERKLVAKAADYLCLKRFEDRDEAEQAAREFIEFCRGRAWVFTDTGTTKEGDRLYQFTHRTFLEYFTASYLKRTYSTPDRLAEVLLPKIAKQEWDVVAQLAFQLQNNDTEDAGDDLLSILIEKAAKTEGEEVWKLLSFATRTLEFMVLSPSVTRTITTACIERSLAWGCEQIEQEQSPEFAYYQGRGELLHNLLKDTNENCTTIANSLENLLIERLKSGSEPESLLAWEISYRLWQSSSKRIFDACSDCIEALYPKYLLPCIVALAQGKVSIVDLVKWHGIESIFREGFFTFFAPRMPSVAESFLYMLWSDPDLSDSSTWSVNKLDNLKELGHILLFSPPPWIKKQQFDLDSLLVGIFHTNSESFQESLSPYCDALCGAFAICAAIFEASYTPDPFVNLVIQEIKKSPSNFFKLMQWLFSARFEQVETEIVQAEMDRCGFSPEQQDFIWRWVRGEINRPLAKVELRPPSPPILGGEYIKVPQTWGI
jgi:hypothetical protein